MLELQDLAVSVGGREILNGIDLEIRSETHFNLRPGTCPGASAAAYPATWRRNLLQTVVNPRDGGIG